MTLDQPLSRVGAFLAVFALMAVLERLWPRRVPRLGKGQRWTTNLSILALGALVIRALAWVGSTLAIPLAAVAAASFAASQNWGILNAWPSGPEWAKTALALVVLDLAVYLQHVASHQVPALWRLHKVHHADVDFDVTTALRFHPLEIGLSMVYKVAWILVLGPSVFAVAVFEIILNACAMFNHANVHLPPFADKALRPLIVTPDMHRIHHSVRPDEHNSNFGFNLSLWDRVFGTYTASPRSTHTSMTIGLPETQHDGPTHLTWSLLLPFSRRNAKPNAATDA